MSFKGLSVLVSGCGSIGRRHALNLRGLGVRRLALHDPDPARLAALSKETGGTPVPSLERGLLGRPDAVLVCAPPALHAAAASLALRSGAACFIEKPLASSLRSALSLVPLARRAPLAVGYQLRCDPGLLWIRRRMREGAWGRLLYLRAAMGQYLPDWRPSQDYRRGYTASRRLGGGVLLDISHEIDLALWLAGPPASVYCAAGRLSGLAVSAEDCAELTLRFGPRLLGSLHLDMFQRGYQRDLQLLFEEATVRWDFKKSTVRVHDASRQTTRERVFRREPNDLYVEELRRFLRAAAGRPLEGLAAFSEAVDVLRVVDAARASARSRRERTLG